MLLRPDLPIFGGHFIAVTSVVTSAKRTFNCVLMVDGRASSGFWVGLPNRKVTTRSGAQSP